MAKKTADQTAIDAANELLGNVSPKARKALTEKLPSVKDVVESANGKSTKGKGKPTATKGKSADKPAKGKATKPAKGKAAAKPTAKATAKPTAKAKAKGNGVGRPSPYADDQKIIVVTPREGRGKVQELWEMVAASKTIGGYKQRREKAGLKGLGGVFASFVKAGNVKVK